MLVRMLKHEAYFLTVLFLCSFLIRATSFGMYFNKDDRYMQYDSAMYHDTAVALASGNGFSNPDGTPHFWRVPGYPTFLAFFYTFVGVKATSWIQIFFASFIPLLIFFLTLVLFPQGMLLAKIASMYAAFHLGLVIFSSFLMSEWLFIIFSLLFFIVYYRAINLVAEKEKSSILSWFMAGIVLGIASLIRPVGHYVLFLSIILLFLSFKEFIHKIHASRALIFGWSIICIPWLVRNFMLGGVFAFHAMAGNHFLAYCIIPAQMQATGASAKEVGKKLNKELDTMLVKEKKGKGRSLSKLEVSVVGQRLAWRHGIMHPWIIIKNGIINMVKTGISLYSSELMRIEKGFPPYWYNKERTWWQVLSRFFIPQVSHPFLAMLIYLEMLFLALTLLGLGGFIFSACTGSFLLWASAIKTVPFIMLFIILSFATGFARMRLPIEPLMIILALHYWLSVMSSRFRMFRGV